jgi:hypothetical protein
MNVLLKFVVCFKQKKRGKGDGGKNKENIIEDDTEVQDEQEEVAAPPEKKLCYEVRHSDTMGR